MMFNEVSFLDRFERAHNAGFKGVEFLFPYEFSKEVVAEKLNTNKLEQVLFNIPPGNFAAGERGLACLPGREEEFRKSVGVAIEYANALKCPRLNCFTGIVPRDVPAEKVKTSVSPPKRWKRRTLPSSSNP
jgi:hydroxypyruvate isomerase